MAFTSTLEMNEDIGRITLSGELDASVAAQFKETIEAATLKNPKRLVFFMEQLEFMASAGLRVLVFAKQKMTATDLYLIGCQESVRNTLEMSGFHRSVYLQDSYLEA